MKNIAIILAGGFGKRMGCDIPKQYLKVDGRPVICHCLERFFRSGVIDAFVLSMGEPWKAFVAPYVSRLGVPVSYSEPGETRQRTIYNALVHLRESGAEDDDIVIIHDAVRPLVSEALIQSCAEACRDYDGVLPVLPLKDTVYASTDGLSISSFPDRSTLFAGQAPEAFRFGKYLKAHSVWGLENLHQINGSAELAYKTGLKIKMIPGDEGNFKLTVPADLVRMKQLIEN